MPRPKEHVVSLTVAGRKELTRVVSQGVHPARMIARARILLALDEAAGPVPDRRDVAARVGVSEGTVFLVAKAFTESGGDVASVIVRKKRVTPPVEPKVTGEVEARILALARSKPPDEADRWTLRLLARKVHLVEGIPEVSHTTIAGILKRGGFRLT
jgi:transposase